MSRTGLQHDELGLLDEYAGLALQGMLSNNSLGNYGTDELAHDSFLFAKAMLRERRLIMKQLAREGLR